MLGFPDDYMTSDTDSSYTNKIGGAPDWPGTTSCETPGCGECGGSMVLVCQLYAPLAGKDRTLYLFSCLQSSCWGSQSSWACLRCQVAQQTKLEETEVGNGAPEATDWGIDDADDWGDDDNVDIPAPVINTNLLPTINKLSLNEEKPKPVVSHKSKEETDPIVPEDSATAQAELEMEAEVSMDDLPMEW